MEVEIRFFQDKDRQPIVCHLEHLPDVGDCIVLNDKLPCPYEVEKRFFYIEENKVIIFIRG